VETLERSPDRLRWRVRSGAPALLVLSEIYYPAWQAMVDGAPAKVYVANHALRAIAVPAGDHEVVMSYRSWTLTLGTVISAVCYLLLAALGAAVYRRRKGR
jgi:uncharacterized membrane protein YfhO